MCEEWVIISCLCWSFKEVTKRLNRNAPVFFLSFFSEFQFRNDKIFWFSQIFCSPFSSVQQFLCLRPKFFIKIMWRGSKRMKHEAHTHSPRFSEAVATFLHSCQSTIVTYPTGARANQQTLRKYDRARQLFSEEIWSREKWKWPRNRASPHLWPFELRFQFLTEKV